MREHRKVERGIASFLLKGRNTDLSEMFVESTTTG
jgi:hypothetical protein